MSNNAVITLTAGSLPSGYCYPSNPQDFYLEMFRRATAVLPGQYNTFNYGNTEPDANDRDKPWFRLGSNGEPDDWYVYFNGMWVAKHKPDANSPEPRFYKGSLASLITYDGGSAGTVSDFTGPMWEEDIDFAGRSPMHPGAIPDTTDTLAVGGNYGQGKHTLTAAEMAGHTHNAANVQRASATGNIADAAGGLLGVGGTNYTAVITDSQGSSTPFNVVHPVRGVYLIKRTARIYRTL